MTGKHKLSDSITLARRNFSGELKKVEKEAKIVIEEYQEAIASFEYIHFGAIVLCYVTAVNIILLIMFKNSRIFIFYLAICLFLAVGFGLWHRNASLTVAKKEQSRKDAEIPKRVYSEALKVLSKHFSLVSDDSSPINEIKYHYLLEIHQQNYKMTDHITYNEENIDYHDLINRMEMLHQACQKIISRIGDTEGTCPISSKRDKLVNCLQSQRK